jgi:hypothetical protein
MTIWRMRIECCITEATDTNSENVILIAFSRRQRSRERASILRLYAISLSGCNIMASCGVAPCSLIDKTVRHHIPYDYCRSIYRPEILESPTVLI